MPTLTDSLGVQSYCFRAIKGNAGVAEAVKRVGLDKVELCAAHVKFGEVEQHAPAIETYRAAWVAIQSIGVEGMGDDEAENRKRFEFAKAAGCRHISINFNPGTFEAAHPIVQKLAEEYDMRLGIHNHGGHHWLGNGQMLDHVFSTTSPRIGLCLDTAWALDASLNPVEAAEKYAARLYNIHIKDFIFDRARKPEDVVVGTGNLDLPSLVATLKKNSFSGPAVLEYEGDVDNPVPALSECVVKIRETAG